MTFTSQRKLIRPLTGAAVLAIALSGCTSQPEQLSGAAEFGHVHGLDIDQSSGTVFAATHNGIWKLPPLGSETIAETELDGPIAGRVQDTMGFTMDDNQMLASGHPDPQEYPDLTPPNLGLIQSYDRAETWEPVSLWGEVDFHDVSAVRQPNAALHIYGYDAATGAVWFSIDSGRNWEMGAQVAIRDLVADPTDPGTLYATAESGLLVSRDNGATFTPAPESPALYLVDAGGDGTLVGVDVDGGVWMRPPGAEWELTGEAEGDVEALAYFDELQTMAVYDSRGVVTSDDRGGTWEVLVSK